VWGTIGHQGLNTLSDRRLKQEIQPLSDALSALIKLRGVSFKWKDKFSPNEEHLQEHLYSKKIRSVFKTRLETDPASGEIKEITYREDEFIGYDKQRFFKQQRSEAGDIQLGFIAQEVAEACPEAVRLANGIYSIDSSKLIPVLVESVKELKAEKDAEIADLQSQVQALQAQVQQLIRQRNNQ
jgi:hypothetical protein